MTTIRSNFLTDRQVYEFELPSGSSGRPELTSALKTETGTREITYREHAPGQGPASNRRLAHRFDLVGPGGKVGIYSPRDGSTMLIAFWTLEKGTLQTFVDDQTACGTNLEQELATVVKALSIEMTPAGLPVVSLKPPVAWSTSRDQFHVDSIFIPPAADRSWPAITLMREPAWAREGAASHRLTDTVRNASVTNVLQVSTHVAGPPASDLDLKRYATRVAETMVPLP